MQEKTTPDSAFGFDSPDHSPGFLLWQTMVTWQRLIKAALDPHKISHSQFVVLANLMWFEEKQQPPTQVAIVNMSKLDKMTVSTSLKSLAQSGFITRKESEQDSRAKHVSLTPAGKKLITKLIPVVEKVDENFFNTLTTFDQADLIRILAQLMRATQHE